MQRGVASLMDIEPLHVATWIEAHDPQPQRADRQAAARRYPPSVRLAGDRPDRADQSGRIGARPAALVKAGKTPVLDPAEARALLDSIDVTTQVGLRDRALIGSWSIRFARVGAALGMKVEDVYTQNRRLWVRLAREGRQGS